MYVWISMSCYRYVIVYHYHCFWHCIIVHCSMTRAASTFWKPPPNSDQDLKYFWMAWESVTSLRRSSKSYDRHLSTAIDQNNLSPGTKTQILTRLVFFCLFVLFLFFIFCLFLVPIYPSCWGGWLHLYCLILIQKCIRNGICIQRQQSGSTKCIGIYMQVQRDGQCTLGDLQDWVFIIRLSWYKSNVYISLP